MNQVVDISTLQFARSILDRYCDGPHMLRAGLIHDKNWCVFPVESGLHINESLAYTIEAVASINKVRTAYVIETEGLKTPFCFEMQLVGEEFLNFNYQCGGFNYLVVPRDEEFCILCSTRDYLLIAGPVEFLMRVFPDGLDKVIKSFELYMNDHDVWTQSEIAAFECALNLHREVDRMRQLPNRAG